MRRLLALLAVLSVVPAGCSGTDAQQAQTLLDQSSRALAEVKSLSFSMRMWTSGGPQDMTFVMRGGGYAKGKRAGEFYVTGSVEGLPGLGQFTMVARDGTLRMNMGQGWIAVPVPEGAAEAGQSPVSGFDLAPYITDVRVEEGQLIAGEPASKITGVIDTGRLVDGALGRLGGLSEAGGLDLSEAFGDTRAVLWVSEVTQLPLRGLIDFSVRAAGEEIELHMDFAVTGVNEPVAIPRAA